MRLYVHMCAVYIHVHMCVCTCICVICAHVCMSARVYTCTSVPMCVHVCVHVGMCVCWGQDAGRREALSCSSGIRSPRTHCHLILSAEGLQPQEWEGEHIFRNRREGLLCRVLAEGISHVAAAPA